MFVFCQNIFIRNETNIERQQMYLPFKIQKQSIHSFSTSHFPLQYSTNQSHILLPYIDTINSLVSCLIKYQWECKQLLQIYLIICSEPTAHFWFQFHVKCYTKLKRVKLPYIQTVSFTKLTEILCNKYTYLHKCNVFLPYLTYNFIDTANTRCV